MKKIKKLLGIIAITLVISGGVVQASSLTAYACTPPKHVEISWAEFRLEEYPGIVFSTKMKNTYSKHVYNIQWMLNRLGYNAGTPDGYYGSNTYNAVYNFQADHTGDCGKPDAIVGKNTWNALRKHCKLIAKN